MLHIGDVVTNYYHDVLVKHVELGSIEKVRIRKLIKERLDSCGGNINQNVDIWQDYINEGNFDLVDEKFLRCENMLLDKIQNHDVFSLNELISAGWNEANINNQYFDQAFETVPEAPLFGRPGASELYLAFFCNGEKPKKGDLNVGGVDIELKGPGGRLYKTPKLVTDFSVLDQQLETTSEILNAVADFISGYAGTLHLRSQIGDMVNLFAAECEREYLYYKDRNKLRPKNILVYIGGLSQLFSYQSAQGFDVFTSFSKSDDNIQFKTIDFRQISNLLELHAAIKKNTWLKFSRNIDGNGWCLDRTQIK
jgi:hypothetical protein